MITGFNTHIEHEGTVYHVQTEDKGLDSPLILSLVYSGGAILASKRSPYADLIESGFSEVLLAERLKRQHRLICAAINAGRLEELKRMGAKPSVPDSAAAVSEKGIELVSGVDFLAVPAKDQIANTESSVDDETIEEQLTQPETEGDASATREPEPSAYTVYDPRRDSAQDSAQAENGTVMTMLDDGPLSAGSTCSIRVLIEDRSRGKERPVFGANVSVKILGTSFRPQIYSVKTERDGVACVNATLPYFTSGRAAVLVRAEVKDETVELRRVIYPAPENS